LNKIYESYKGKPYELLAINLGDDKSQITGTISEKGIKYNVLADTESSTMSGYGIEFIPLNILIDVNGKIVHRDNPIPSEDLINKAIAEVK
jgi:peroxiredoxin